MIGNRLFAHATSQSRSAMTPPRVINLFTEHSRSWKANRYVYPVISRRSKGLSIGVNLNPDKVCNFDCIYCCVDRSTMPGRVEVDLVALLRELDHMLVLVRNGELWAQPPFDQAPAELRRLNDIAFSGDGEPTSFPKFEEACRLAADGLLRAGLNDTKLVVISNATLFHQPRVERALAYLDTVNGEIWAKLDAGTEPYYHAIERTAVLFRQVLHNLTAAARVRPIVIQSLFMNVKDQPPPGGEITAYVGRLHDIRSAGGSIKLVQVYTVARGTAEAYVQPLDRMGVDDIVRKVREAGFNAEGYYGPE
jgi:wyosine [tRNA(Phe)-imidazoG37] synthetase (radical SAM superfamily)